MISGGYPYDHTQNILFGAPWGEKKILLAEEYLILDAHGIYGVAEKEFKENYCAYEDPELSDGTIKGTG